MSNAYAYKHCAPNYRSCQVEPPIQTELERLKRSAEKVIGSDQPTLYHPNPFAPHGGAKEWCSNDLLLQDVEMRRRALVRPLDCGITDMILLNPEPQI